MKTENSRIIGVVTCEDVLHLELAINTELLPKKLFAKKAQYPHLKQGDIFIVELIKAGYEKPECKCEDKNTDYHLLNCAKFLALWTQEGK